MEDPLKAASIEKRPGCVNLAARLRNGEGGCWEGGKLSDARLTKISVKLPPCHEATVIFRPGPGQSCLDPYLEGSLIVLSVESVFENLEIIATNLRARTRNIDDLEIQMVTIPQSGLNGQVDLKA